MSRMKTSLDHLPDRKRVELDRVKDILFEEFDAARMGGTQKWRRSGQIVKIILFGSYARGDWVEEPHTSKGYLSDYDLLVIVNYPELIKRLEWSDRAYERILRARSIKTPVGLIVHDRGHVNSALAQGQTFFTDIKRDGIVIHDAPGFPLAEPKDLSPEETYQLAQEYFEDRIPFARTFGKSFRLHQQDGDIKHAAFILHQMVENAYRAFLLVQKNYDPAGHNLLKLRGLCEGIDQRLVEAWPRHHKRHRAWLNRLNEAYVKARYSPHFEITDEALVWLGKRANVLIDLIEQTCEERLESLKGQT